jgi:hypothetical protein
VRWPFRRPTSATHENERVGARVVLARLDAALDRMDGVWERYYQPVIEPKREPGRPERGEGS